MNSATGASKRTDAQANRARLLAVAQAEFAEAGLDLEVNNVISRAKLGVGTFYRHFGSREDLLRAIVIQTVEDAQAQIHQAIAPYEDDSRAALQALVSATLRVVQQYRPIAVVIRDPRLTKLFDPAQRENLLAQFLSPTREVIQRGIQAGLFREDLDPDLAVATIIASITGISGFLGERFPFDELEQRLSQLLWTMLTK